MAQNFDMEQIKTILRWIGKEGPIELVTNMMEHGDLEGLSREEKVKWGKKEVMLVGKAGELVGVKEVLKFLSKVEGNVNERIFHENRTYWFEGIRKVKNKRYELMWGS